MARYGIIGFGRIGRRIAERMRGLDAPRLVAVLVRPDQAESAAGELRAAETICTDLDTFIARNPEIAVECASTAMLAECGAKLLESGIDLVPLSLAAFADPRVEARLRDAAARGPGRIELAAGAMAALDFLATARENTLGRVIFRAAFPPARWRGTPAETFTHLSAVTARTLFFRGSVREVAKMFPRHLNVSVGVALAGLGLDATEAELFADPALSQAEFEVEALADSGPIRLHVGPCDVPAGAHPVDHTTFSVIGVLRRRVARLAV